MILLLLLLRFFPPAVDFVDEDNEDDVLMLPHISAQVCWKVLRLMRVLAVVWIQNMFS